MDAQQPPVPDHIRHGHQHVHYDHTHGPEVATPPPATPDDGSVQNVTVIGGAICLTLGLWGLWVGGISDWVGALLLAGAAFAYWGVRDGGWRTYGLSLVVAVPMLLMMAKALEGLFWVHQYGPPWLNWLLAAPGAIFLAVYLGFGALLITGFVGAMLWFGAGEIVARLTGKKLPGA